MHFLLQLHIAAPGNCCTSLPESGVAPGDSEATDGGKDSSSPPASLFANSGSKSVLATEEGRETSSDMFANTKRIEVSRQSLTSSLEPRMATGKELQLLNLDRKLDRAASKLATHWAGQPAKLATHWAGHWAGQPASWPPLRYNSGDDNKTRPA